MCQLIYKVWAMAIGNASLVRAPSDNTRRKGRCVAQSRILGPLVPKSGIDYREPEFHASISPQLTSNMLRKYLIWKAYVTLFKK